MMGLKESLEWGEQFTFHSLKDWMDGLQVLSKKSLKEMKQAFFSSPMELDRWEGEKDEGNVDPRHNIKC